MHQVSMEEIQASDPPMPVDYDEQQEHSQASSEMMLMKEKTT